VKFLAGNWAVSFTWTVGDDIADGAERAVKEKQYPDDCFLLKKKCLPAAATRLDMIRLCRRFQRNFPAQKDHSKHENGSLKISKYNRF
jgi:hypothetical protein